MTIEGETHHVRAGDMCFFPADVFHSVRVTSERAKVLIIYSPPYAEQPAGRAQVAHAALRRRMSAILSLRNTSVPC